MQINVLDGLSPGRSHAGRLEERLQLALEAGKLGAWEYDTALGVLSSTAQCKANHGLAPDADLQLERDLLPTIDPDYRDTFRAAIQTAVETHGAFEIEVPNTWPDGSRHWLLVAGRVVDDRWMVGVSRDTTRQHDAEDALVEADRRKDEFLALLGHELRNPLAPILTAARILQVKGPATPELVKARAAIVRQTMQLAKLVDDLLDVGRIAAGKLRLQIDRVELNALLREAAETCAQGIEHHRHTLDLILADRPVYVDADAGRLLQVVCNLLHNAVKYMRDGGRIQLAVSRADGAAVIRVRDEGVGIPPHMLEEIFNRFVQLGASQERSEGGLGIGLSLVKALVDLHGGTVTARSDGIGTGSEFIVRLPLAPD